MIVLISNIFSIDGLIGLSEGIGHLLLWTAVGSLALLAIHYLSKAKWSEHWLVVACKMAGLAYIAVPLLIVSLVFGAYHNEINRFGFVYWRDIWLYLSLLYFVFKTNRRLKQKTSPSKWYFPVLAIFILLFAVVISVDLQMLFSGKLISKAIPFYHLSAGLQAGFAGVIFLSNKDTVQFQKHYAQYFNLLNWLWFYFLFVQVLIISYAGIPGEFSFAGCLALYHSRFVGSGVLLCGFVLPSLAVLFGKNYWNILRAASLIVLLGKIIEFMAI